MTGYLQEMLSYPFMLRAAVLGLAVSVAAALLGVSLVLKRYAMIGQGLSQVAFAALAVATVFGWTPISVAMPATLIASFFILRIQGRSGLHGDAVIAMISSLTLAFGVFLISLSTGINTDICNYLFGSILAATEFEMYLGLGLMLLVIAVYLICYRQLFNLTFDEDFALVSGMHIEVYRSLLALLAGSTIVLGMRTLGTLLISALVVFPAMTALQIAQRFRSVLLLSITISVACFSLGLLLSYAYGLPPGASVVLLNGICFVFAYGRRRILARV
ncbi:MAG: metal ABC transporter permease [Eubacteriales bacterium]|nr:metal ABC transporter permease [Eubacteriales bacterium]